MNVVRLQSSVVRGHPATFVVSVWTLYGPATNVAVGLSATPSSQHAVFTLGCGSGDGSSNCNIGTVDSKSAARQLQAQITVSSADTSVGQTAITAIATAQYAKGSPTGVAGVAVTTPHTPPPPSHSPSPGNGNGSSGQSTQIPIGPIPSLQPGGGSSVNRPAGSVGGLFPTINPASTASPHHSRPGARPNLRAEPAADVVSLGTPVVGAQIAGLAALAMAFVLAVTRLSLRRKPAKATAAASESATPKE